MKKIYIFILIFTTTITFSQKVDVFSVARNGTLAQIKAINSNYPDLINSVNENKSSPLILACYRGNTEVAYYLIERVKDINYNSGMGTALMAAVVKGNIDLTKSLIEKGANLDLTDNQGNTALIYAVQFNNIEIVSLLLQNNANKSILNKAGKTAFEIAAFSGDEKLINLLK